MDLTHAFQVPADLDETWTTFGDIAGLAECFPGAQVTSVDTDDDGAPTFEGTCKVKLGPIALVYAGAGRFVERDEKEYRFVVHAKGRDKRGNGTAGAKVTVTMKAVEPDESGEQTRVEVVTDLAITGKPAQFGRGVMQDVSDKLLSQFVARLEERMVAPAQPAEVGAGQGTGLETDQDGGPASVPTGAAAVDAPGEDQDAGPASAPPPDPDGGGPTSMGRPVGVGPSAGQPAGQSVGRAPTADDALDLGSAVLPVLVKSYGKRVALGLAVLLALGVVLRRRRNRRNRRHW
ncbi:SRPBCC family protein [Nocardioides sp. zg-536]|uniref:SRPBCC family protein n=1 Tax=Nocardioides faecalis TaxID=2803858 RepID=A0A938XZL2_9ACTN|nr:SRPBCC family protein [Nocardioides faecalis]MBM9459422.1 SRPBCC family protein [Nocardioides faecalis]QVI59471.1 SRPBCC family protein [Nocardioides faecalis]